VRDYEATTYVSSFKSIDAFGPLLRPEAIRRGLGSAGKVVVLIRWAVGLENMGRLCFKDCWQSVDCFHALAHAGPVLDALIGKTHPDYKKQLRRWARRRLKDKVQALIKETRQPGTGKLPAAVVEQTLGCLCSQREPEAVGNLPSSGLLHRFGCGRSRLQDRPWRSLQTIGHVSGRSPEPKTSSLGAAFTAAVASRTFGNIGLLNRLLATILAAGSMMMNFVSHPDPRKMTFWV